MNDTNSKTGLIVAIVAILAVVGGIVWYTTSQNDEEATSSPESSQQTEMAETENSQDIVALASGTEDLSTLVAAVQAADLVATLQGEGPFTVFAPTNAAFNALPAGTLDSLLEPANKEQLSGILTYHVVAGNITSDQLTDGQKVETVNGETLTVKIQDGKVMIMDAAGGTANVTSADVKASNGVVHIIDAVLLPQ